MSFKFRKEDAAVQLVDHQSRLKQALLLLALTLSAQARPLPPDDLQQFECRGTYRRSVYSVCTVQVSGQNLQIQLGNMQLPLTHRDTDTFTYPDPMEPGGSPGFASFTRNPDGSARELRLKLAADVLDGRFQRQ